MLLEDQTSTAPGTFPVQAYSVSYFRFDTEQIGEAHLKEGREFGHFELNTCRRKLQINGLEI